jgi:hypothetical protein
MPAGAAAQQAPSPVVNRAGAAARPSQEHGGMATDMEDTADDSDGPDPRPHARSSDEDYEETDMQVGALGHKSYCSVAGNILT